MTFSAPRKTCLHIAAAALLAAACTWTFPSSSRAQDGAQNPPGRVGRLALIDGTVSYHTADQNYWQAARRNYPVTTGQSFWTEPNAHAAIDIGSNRIYLDSSTELDISALDDTAAQLSLPQGALFVGLRTLDRAEPYEVQMARAAVTLTAAGRYELIAGDTGHASQVTVFDGAAHVSGNGLDADVRAGETAVLSGEQTVRAEVHAAGPADELVAWVEAQEHEEQRYRDNAPAAASAMTGGAELGGYGRWARAARYGDIWYPDVPAGWAPYRDGYWAWVEPWGWTWIDAEAWGFAPFHYGRWLMVDDRWAWMPGDETAAPIAAIYAPALVTFFTAGDLCAWVPLGPDEVYVPSYPVSLSYFQSINAVYVAGIRSRNRIATERTRINAYANQRGLTAVPRSVVSGSQPVRAHARAVSASQLADARPAMGTRAVRPSARTAGVSPAVARQFGIAGNALAAAHAHAHAHAPGPPIHAVAPSANARLAAPHALAPTTAGRAGASSASPSSAPQPPPHALPHALPHAPALAQPGVVHHLPGSPVGQAGASGANRGSEAGPPSSPTPPRHQAPPALAHTPQGPGAHPAPSSETAGHAGPHVAPSRPAPPAAVSHALPQRPIRHAAPAPETIGRPSPRAPAVAHHAPPPAVAHRRPSPPVVHAAPHPATIGRAPPPRAAFAAPHPAPPVVHARPPVVHAAPPATVGRAPPPAAHAPPAAAAPGRRPGH
ncbi:MAG TPA: DUF6600 domain-containing protein [Xanthobacteraceae bacterium]|jgi:hypothetical protein